MYYAARSCPDPGNIMNGMRKGELYYYPHTIEIICLPGYQLIGSSILRCLSSGQWSAQLPHCKRNFLNLHFVSLCEYCPIITIPVILCIIKYFE